jgi:hypothetical protein
MDMRRILGVIALVGGISLAVTGLSHPASAAGICFNGLTTGFVSPDRHSSASFTPDNTGINASGNSGVTILSITLHLADGTATTTTFPAGTTTVTDVHATPRQIIASYDICKDEPVGPTTTPPTTVATTTTTTPTTSPTTSPTTVLVTTTRVTSPELTTAPPTTGPTTSGSVLGTTIVTLPPTGGDHSGTGFAAAIALVGGLSLLALSRRTPAS